MHTLLWYTVFVCLAVFFHERSIFMPGFTTHYLFGVKTCHRLGASPLRRELMENHTAFGLGLQGPDIFFYDLPSYVIYKNNIGSVAHTTDTGKFLFFLLQSRFLFPKGKKRQIAESYIAGFIGHYLLDTTCHPYVYDRSKSCSDSATAFAPHVYLETDIDTAFLRHYKKKLPSEFYQERTIALSQTGHFVIAKILHHCYSNVYPNLHVSFQTTLRATYFMPLAAGLLHDNTGKKKALARKCEGLLFGYPYFSALIPSDFLQFSADPLNQAHRPWKNPWNENAVSTASFPSLFSSASRRYAGYLKRLDELFSCKNEAVLPILEGRLLADLGNKSYHSGMDCRIPS